LKITPHSAPHQSAEDLQNTCNHLRRNNIHKQQNEEVAAAMRLPYVDPSDPNAFTGPEEAAIVSRVRARRAPRPLQPLDLTLLHSPAVADGWNSFLGAIRTKTSLSDDVREIAICRVAVINEAWYEWAHHAPLAKAGGVSDEGLRILGETDLGGKSGSSELTEKQWAVVYYTDAMTRDVAVKDEAFEALKKHFSEQEVVEVTATVS
jgi:alkylhydroperoxidase family enzyme